MISSFLSRYNPGEMFKTLEFGKNMVKAIFLHFVETIWLHGHFNGPFYDTILLIFTMWGMSEALFLMVCQNLK